MRRCPSLEKLQNAFDERVVRLERLVSTINPGMPESDRLLSYASIEALSAWSSFAREFYLSCCFLGARTLTGNFAHPTSAQINNERDALLYSIQLLKHQKVFARASRGASISPRDEPTWHDAVSLVRLSASLGLSNDGSVLSGLSYPTTFFRDMPVVRNFYAHRNKITANRVETLAAANYNAPSFASTSTFIGTILPNRSQSLINEWLGDLRLISHEICR